MPVTEEQREEITRALKRCSDETVAAALRIQDHVDESDLDAVIRGVLARDLQEERLPSLSTAAEDSRLVEDIGMDSFGMIEVVMTAEEVFGVTVSNEEMKGITTLGGLKSFLRAKLEAKHSGGAA